MVSDQLRNSDEDSRSKQASTLKYNEFVKILGSENQHDLEALKRISEVTRPSKTPNQSRRQEFPGFNVHMRITKAKKARRLKPINAYGNTAQKQAAEHLFQRSSIQQSQEKYIEESIN